MMLLMALLFLDYFSQTKLSSAAKHAACGLLVTGILPQSGGVFIHMTKGEEDKPSLGTTHGARRGAPHRRNCDAAMPCSSPTLNKKEVLRVPRPCENGGPMSRTRPKVLMAKILNGTANLHLSH
jgi:hypothetical protein